MQKSTRTFRKILLKPLLVAGFCVAGISSALAQFPNPYCNVTFPSGTEPITRVVFMTIDNASSATIGGPLGLQDFLSISATVNQGSNSLPIAVEGNTDGEYTNHIMAFFDWNQDGDFDDTGESFSLGTLYDSDGTDGQQATGTINVPADALIGTTRMRIVKRFNTVPGPCNAAGYGQAEDYTITVEASATVNSVTVSTQGGVAPTITVDGGTLQLEASVDPGSGPQTVVWSIIPGTANAAISSSGLVSSLGLNGTVWAKAASTANAAVADSIEITLSNQLPLFPAPYCNYTVNEDVEPITRVIFAGIDNPSSGALNGSPALENFTAITGNVTQGDTANIAVEGNTFGEFTNHIMLYVDWNNDGDFDDTGESFSLGTLFDSDGTDGQQATADIAIPSDATIGSVRMRVTKRFSSAGGPCNTTGWAQAEDYTLIVSASSTGTVDSVTVSTQGGVPATITVNAGTLQLEAEVHPGSASQNVTWSIANGTGSATISATGLVTAQTNGTVTATATSVEDPSKSGTLIVTISNQNPVGVEELSRENLSIFPNPSSEVVFISLDRQHPALHAKIIDMQGKLVMTWNIPANTLNGGQHKINLSSLPKGQYILQLDGQDVFITRQVLKM